MNRSSAWMFLCMACFALTSAQRCAAQATKPSNGSIDLQVRALARELAAPDSDHQNIAQSKLQKLGQAAVGSIRQLVAETEDEQVRSRLEAVLQMLTSVPAPTRVTLHLKEVTAREAIDQLSKQAPIAFLAQRPAAVRQLSSTKLSLDVQDEPFWKVLARICEAAELRPEALIARTGPSIALSEEPGHWSVRYTDVHDTFAVSALFLTRQILLNFGKLDTAPSPVQLELVYAALPLLHNNGPTEIQITRCVDETGQEFPSEVDRTLLAPGLIWFRHFALLLHPPRGAKQASIDGEIKLMAESTTHVVIPDVRTAVNVLHAAGGVRFSLESVLPTGPQQWTVRIRVLQDNRTPLEMTPIVRQFAIRPPTMTDGLNRPLEPAAVSNSPITPEGVELQYRFTNRVNRGKGVPTEPDTLTWDIPVSGARVIIPFHFQDLPLP